MSYNFSAMIVGLPGQGKTTLVTQLIGRHLETTRGIVLAHDPVQQFTRIGCRWYKDAHAWRLEAAAAAAKQQPMPRGAAIGGNAEDVVRLALELGEKLNTADAVAVPILVPFDEASLRDGSGSTYASKEDTELLSLRRHRGVAPIFNLQEIKQLTARFYRMSTDVYLFRQTSDRALELDSLLFLERGTLEAAGVTQLEQHHYVHVQVGVGVVDAPL